LMYQKMNLAGILKFHKIQILTAITEMISAPLFVPAAVVFHTL
jgi:hypothetical protein